MQNANSMTKLSPNGSFSKICYPLSSMDFKLLEITQKQKPRKQEQQKQEQEKSKIIK